jgi:hypothetical protein
MIEPFAWFRYQQGSRVYYDTKEWDDCQPLYRFTYDFDALMRNRAIEEVAQHIEKLTGFGQDTISSFAIYVREMKK